MCKRAILWSLLQDQNPCEQPGEDSDREEEEGGHQQGGAGQVHSHPATAPACSRPWHKDPAKVAPTHKYLTGKGQELFLGELVGQCYAL